MRMPRTHWLNAALLAGAVLLAAPAAALAAPAQADQCFLSSDVSGFRAHDDKTPAGYIRVGVSEIYRLDLMSNCFDLSYRERLGFEHTPGNPWICSPLDATVVYGEHGIPNRCCPVTGIHKLTPDEITALPKKDKP